MCDCIKTVNELLAPHNTQVVLPIFGPKQPFVETMKIDEKKRGKPQAMFASCCPFCGERYSKGKPDPALKLAGEA